MARFMLVNFCKRHTQDKYLDFNECQNPEFFNLYFIANAQAEH